jgi:hypothetical protein
MRSAINKVTEAVIAPAKPAPPPPVDSIALPIHTANYFAVLLRNAADIATRLGTLHSASDSVMIEGTDLIVDAEDFFTRQFGERDNLGAAIDVLGDARIMRLAAADLTGRVDAVNNPPATL